jgi:hypothetical protein
MPELDERSHPHRVDRCEIYRRWRLGEDTGHRCHDVGQIPESLLEFPRPTAHLDRRPTRPAFGVVDERVAEDLRIGEVMTSMTGRGFRV